MLVYGHRQKKDPAPATPSDDIMCQYNNICQVFCNLKVA